MNEIEPKTADENGIVVIAPFDEFAPGARVVVRVERAGKMALEIGVFNVNGTLVAYRNVCPHAGAPICQGKIGGTTRAGAVGEFVLEREGEIVRCPWHGWEFDLLTGAQLVDEKLRLKAYEVSAQTSELEAYEVATRAGEVVLKLP